ncbi:hypothetical protein AMTR_s00030p00244290 [Amborella trichopoda]|uniref:Uncharacterized protein n=1 Tax=Amborella trichopoda TaxID=13333 RepID=U5D1U1_AMBTC|nr:hypothetical protein AMTR_s00030p00244290 [Amborella trichopoda]
MEDIHGSIVDAILESEEKVKVAQANFHVKGNHLEAKAEVTTTTRGVSLDSSGLLRHWRTAWQGECDLLLLLDLGVVLLEIRRRGLAGDGHLLQSDH